MSSWTLLLLPLAFSSSVSSLCSKVITVTNRTDDPAFCIREASRMNPSSFIAFANGSCQLFNVCPSDSTPMYARVRPHCDYVLLRIVNGSSPYDLLTNGQSDVMQRSFASLMASTNPYRSPLLAIPGRDSPLRRVSLLFLDRQGARSDVNLTFRIDVGKAVSDDNAWFKKKNLVYSHPWKLESLLAKEVNYRMTEALQRRRFLISVKNAACDFSGFIIVIEDTAISCTWEKLQKERPAYFWGNHEGGAIDFSDSKFSHSKQFLLQGSLDSSDDKVYVRVEN